MVDDRVVLITGTSRGLGRALVEHLLAAGACVVGCSRKPTDLVSPRYHHHVLDVTDDRAVRAMFGAVRAEFGHLDVLVNNAGIASMNLALLTVTETVEEILATNVTATFVACREAARLMRRRGGRIVNIVSVAVPLRLVGEAAYVASKAAVVALTEVLARELGPMGITVNGVGPGPIDTDLIAGVADSTIDTLLQRLVFPRKSTPADVANVIDFLIDAKSGAVTGQTIYLGGP
jgi:3-oxoacyl-[acyl-carrier protein] reductase